MVDENTVKQALNEAEVSSVNSAWDAQWVKISCPLPGFEGVTLEINVNATGAEVAALDSSDAEGRDKVIRNIEGWTHSSDPWSREDTPLAWIAWLNNRSFRLAMDAYLNDPNSSTA